jgi:hypothetical protein
LLGEGHLDTLVVMGNLAETLRVQGDLAGARKLQEHVLDALRRLLGGRHSDTTSSAWDLYVTVEKLGDAEAHAIFKRDLSWLIDQDPARLSADQQKIREQVIRVNVHE